MLGLAGLARLRVAGLGDDAVCGDPGDRVRDERNVVTVEGAQVAVYIRMRMPE